MKKTIPSTANSNILAPRRDGDMILCPPGTGNEACLVGKALDEPFIMDPDESTRPQPRKIELGMEWLIHEIWEERGAVMMRKGLKKTVVAGARVVLPPVGKMLFAELVKRDGNIQLLTKLADGLLICPHVDIGNRTRQELEKVPRIWLKTVEHCGGKAPCRWEKLDTTTANELIAPPTVAFSALEVGIHSSRYRSATGFAHDRRYLETHQHRS
ncbi:predicted protein [Histoplasma capsulatum G186AR]|uniref:Uncharacterized protein n=1 Tax=Ajellomyces capsulatus (strain G186AR / H82 / ATCC MYA-2454 / RMSCC 2432) TaxID=447093 RepID=C0NQR8_AJECG|nr:uncharacterized protein HCBG_05348 [Histoplasma capsulatum G186AR]EEH06031.1 predicted protein [Histoplasma capsulatum G186AR]